MQQEHDTGLRPGDGLLVVDVQVDFCPGGALPVAGGDQVVPVLNRWIREAAERGLPVYLSRDWHPGRHVSFSEQGGPWPVHCVQDTRGAAFHADLTVPEGALKVTKGVRLDHDQNSAFDDTGLADQLRRDGVERLWVGGLAQDVCVQATVVDARKAGFRVRVILEATRPVSETGGEESLEKMRSAGAELEPAGTGGP